MFGVPPNTMSMENVVIQIFCYLGIIALEHVISKQIGWCDLMCFLIDIGYFLTKIEKQFVKSEHHPHRNYLVDFLFLTMLFKLCTRNV